MSVSSIESPSNLDDRIERLLQRVDYRRADTAEERAAIYRLRYNAYLREGAIAPNFSEQFSDAVDERDNVWIFGVYIDGRLASSIRLSITIPGSNHIPALDVFSDVLLGGVLAGKRTVDPTRFVADRESSRANWNALWTVRRSGRRNICAHDLLATVRSGIGLCQEVLGHHSSGPPALSNLQADQA